MKWHEIINKDKNTYPPIDDNEYSSEGKDYIVILFNADENTYNIGSSFDMKEDLYIQKFTHWGILKHPENTSINNCPLCNGYSILMEENRMFTIMCPDCGININNRNEEEIRRIWNKRYSTKDEGF